MIAWPDPTDHRDCHPDQRVPVGVLSGSYPIPDPAPDAEDDLMDDETKPDETNPDETDAQDILGPDPVADTRQVPGPEGAPPPRPRPALRRDMEHRMLGGVAAGLARYLDVDVVIVRVVIAALTLLGGAGALI